MKNEAEGSSIISAEEEPMKDEVPFRGGLVLHVEHGTHSTLKQAAGNEAYVIREAAFTREPLTAFEIAQALKRHFRELNGYGISAPVDMVVGKNAAGDEVAYVITKNIAGTNLKTLLEQKLGKTEREQLRDILPAHYESLLEYFAQKFRDKTEFLADISRSDQYVFGTHDEASTTRLYLVDTEGQKRSDAGDLVTDLFEIGEELLLLEKSGITLMETKIKLCALLSDIIAEYEGKPRELGMAYNAEKGKRLIAKLGVGSSDGDDA